MLAKAVANIIVQETKEESGKSLHMCVVPGILATHINMEQQVLEWSKVSWPQGISEKMEQQASIYFRVVQGVLATVP